MTVRDVCKVIVSPKQVDVAINANAYTLFNDGAEQYDAVMVDAFGDYVVSEISAISEGVFEIEVKMKPMKKEDIA